MKFKVTFKDPDCMVNHKNKDIDYIDQLPPKARETVDRFLEWSEYVTIEFDTKDQTARVLET